MINKSIWQKQLPTILGLGILIVALVVGVVVFTIGGGAGVFAPRATAQTTPKKIKITNVTDTGFTISFLTEEKTPGFVKYGTESKQLKSQSSDDRDQLSGTIGSYNMHHITVRGLQPNTKYFYLLGTGSASTFDNNGSPFEITTTKRSGAPSAAKTAYGNVLNTTGGPADGAIVYLTLTGVGEMSSLVKNSGSWAVPLSNARTSDGAGYAQITDDQSVTLQVQGTTETESATLTTTVANTQPVTTITLAAGGAVITDDQSATATADSTDQTTTQPDDLVAMQEETQSQQTDTNQVDANQQQQAEQTGGLDNMLSESQTATDSSVIVDVDSTKIQEVTTTQPTIIGTASASVTINIEINSDTQITQQITTAPDGSYQLDLASLQKSLEPGEHTVTISYTDPTTGKIVTKTQTFTVAQSDSVQLAQVPYGSGNPYPIDSSVSAQASVSASPSPTASASAASTPSARTSMPSTSSALPVSGSVGSTLALVIGGIFFCLAGLWSFWIANEYKEATIKSDE